MTHKYIIFLTEQEAIDLIDQINTCKGYPSNGTITWQDYPDEMCEFNLQTGDKINIGYGVIIEDRCLDCLTQNQIDEIIILPSNINTCLYNPLIE